MSYREASKVYGIHHSVIYRRVKNPNIKTESEQTVLTTLEENTIVIVSSIVYCAEWG